MQPGGQESGWFRIDALSAPPSRGQIQEKVSASTHWLWKVARSSFGSRWRGRRGIDRIVSMSEVTKASPRRAGPRPDRASNETEGVIGFSLVSLLLNSTVTSRPDPTPNRLASALRHLLGTILLYNTPFVRKSSGQTGN